MRRVAAVACGLIGAVTCISSCGNPTNLRAPNDSVVVIPATAEPCGDCIVLGDSVRIGSERDSVIVSTVPRVAVDSRGRTYLAESLGSGRLIMVYDREGKFTGTLGSRGKSPGEYVNVYSIAVGPGDSLFVAADWRKLLVFAPDGTLARVVRTEVDSPGFLAVLPDGRLLAVEALYTRELAGLPVHLVDKYARARRSAEASADAPIADRRRRTCGLVGAALDCGKDGCLELARCHRQLQAD